MMLWDEGCPQGGPLAVVCYGLRGQGVGWLPLFVGDVVVGVDGEYIGFVDVVGGLSA